MFDSIHYRISSYYDCKGIKEMLFQTKFRGNKERKKNLLVRNQM